MIGRCSVQAKALGRRCNKTTSPWELGEIRHAMTYVWDSWELVGQRKGHAGGRWFGSRVLSHDGIDGIDGAGCQMRTLLIDTIP